MTETTRLHHEAMELLDQAVLARAGCDLVSEASILKEAFKKEREAALLLFPSIEAEPTRSVLFRSAASIAVRCGLWDEAEKLASAGLAGNCAPELRDELRHVLETATFRNHLDVSGVELTASDIQLSLVGDAVGDGMVPSSEVVSRLDAIRKMNYRTAQRLQSKPFLERMRGRPNVSQVFPVYLSAPRYASFALTIRIGDARQLELPGVSIIDDVVAEVLDCLEAINKDGVSGIIQRIPDQAYRRNFLALSKRILPDGKRIKTVGLTALTSGQERRIGLRTKSSDVRFEDGCSSASVGDNCVSLKGYLKYADATRGGRSSSEIGLVDEYGESHKIQVPDGLMDDIVKPLWGDLVIVSGISSKSKVLLQNIEAADE